MKKKIFIGLDPGKSGFIAIFNPETGEYEFHAMPTEKVDSGKRTLERKVVLENVFSPKLLLDLSAEIRERYKDYMICGMIEEVGGRQGWSAQNNFTFGHTAGIQYSVMSLMCDKILFVRPQMWQSKMYLGIKKTMVPSSTGKTMVHDTKATSARVAQDIEPGIDFRRTTRSKNIDDNKTDAFLLCRYAFLYGDYKK